MEEAMKKMTEVQAAKLAALSKEFPFLGRYIPNMAWLESIPKVQRLDLNLLEGRGYSRAWGLEKSGRSGYNLNGEIRYIFIDTDGQEIGEAEPMGVQYVKERPSFRNLWLPMEKPVFTEGETVLEALRRLEDPEEVAYVLFVGDVCCDLRETVKMKHKDFVDHRGLLISIYKVPMGHTLSSWINELSSAAQKELQNHVAKLDKV